MKQNYGLVLSLLATLIIVSGCAMTGGSSGTGGAWLTMGTTEGILVTAHKAGTKTGTACTSNILGLYSSGDASIDTAAKAGGITNVSTVDRQYTNYAYFYGKMCTIVTGN